MVFCRLFDCLQNKKSYKENIYSSCFFFQIRAFFLLLLLVFLFFSFIFSYLDAEKSGEQEWK